jgi:transposase
MLTLPPSIRIYVASRPVDMRRGHDGLLAIVRSDWKQDPFSGHLFVFLGRRRDRVKVLLWQRGGFVLYYKRLERGRFRMPQVSSDGAYAVLDATELSMLLDGIDIGRVARPRLWEPPVATRST